MPGVRPGFSVHRPDDRAAMLRAIGVESVDELLADIPGPLRLRRALNLPGPHNEWELQRRVEQLAAQNATVRSHLSFLGGGAYDHFIPSVVDVICGRGEFLTAYTPYQPEMSQGLLQVLYEFQSLISKLVGLPVANSSLYDGATALAEAAWMACTITGRRTIVASAALWPEWVEVLETYMWGRGVELRMVRPDRLTGAIVHDDVLRELDNSVAALLLQTPNRFGVLEELRGLGDAIHKNGSLLVVAQNPVTLTLLESPGSMAVDIFTCEGQPLGIPLSAGGPYLGIIATREEFVPYLPGRLVGVVADLHGENAFALIREEREQHVSRERATSHICSNQALQAMRAAVYLTTMGESGLRDVSEQSAAKAHYLAAGLLGLPGAHLMRSGDFFNEFAIGFGVAAGLLLSHLRERGVFGGLDMASWEPDCGDGILIAVTETHTRTELDRAISEYRVSLDEVRGR